MSTGSDAESDTPVTLESEIDADGKYRMYDPGTEEAWIRTDRPVSLDEMA